MNEPIITFEKVEDEIMLEDQFEFSAKTTLGLAKSTDFYIKIDFIKLNENDFAELVRLSKLPRRLSIKSKAIAVSKYKITHIVIEKFKANSLLEMTWECLSDDSELYKFIINS